MRRCFAVANQPARSWGSRKGSGMSQAKPRILIFGCGSSGRRAYELLQNSATIVGFVDNNSALQGSRLREVPVFPPGDISGLDWDRVHIASMYHAEIRAQLVNQLGVEAERIDLAAEFERPIPAVKKRGRTLRDRLSGWLRWHSLPADGNDLKLWRCKNRHRDRRAFVLGNGPSLKMEFLARLQGQVSFGMNQVFKCFPQTPWRPTYYVLSDTLVARSHGAAILRTYPGLVFASEHLRPDLGEHRRVVYFRKTNETGELREPEFSPNALWCLVGGYTTAYLCFQLGWFMGVRDFITLGIDASYRFDGAKSHGRTGAYECISNAPSGNYFLPDYIEKDAVMLKPHVAQQVLAYQATRRFVESHGGRVRNAGAGSPLEAFPKISFDELVRK